MIAYHVEQGADLTLVVLKYPSKSCRFFWVMTVNDENRIVRFDEKPANPTELEDLPGHTLASMGNYIFNADFYLISC